MKRRILAITGAIAFGWVWGEITKRVTRYVGAELAAWANADPAVREYSEYSSLSDD
jgi:hypothetical protein